MELQQLLQHPEAIFRIASIVAILLGQLQDCNNLCNTKMSNIRITTIVAIQRGNLYNCNNCCNMQGPFSRLQQLLQHPRAIFKIATIVAISRGQ